jgi:hypothetical protein
MASSSPEFKFVTAVAKANVYFDGKVGQPHNLPAG